MIIETHVVFEANGRLFESRDDALRHNGGVKGAVKRRTVTRNTGRRYWKPVFPAKKRKKKAAGV
jgi:hypothetical protein